MVARVGRRSPRPTVARSIRVAEVPPCPDRPAFDPSSCLSIVTLLATLAWVPAAAAHQQQQKPKPLTERAILFAADGMRPDKVDRYADQGAMPTFKRLMRDGVKGTNGLVQAFPPNTGVGLAHPRDRHVSGRARLDEQHLPPDRRGQLQQSHRLRHGWGPPGRSHRPGRRTGRPEGRLRGMGRHAEPPQPVDPGSGRRLPHLLLEPRRADQLRPARASRPAPMRSVSATSEPGRTTR